MNGSVKRRRVLGGALALAGSLAVACDLHVVAVGVVQDAAGAPLPGVLVMLESRGRYPDKATTGADGTFNVGIVGADPHQSTLSFEKAGYAKVTRPLGSEARTTVDVVMAVAAATQ